MTAEQLQAIRERADKATPGPWDIILNGHNIKVERTPANIDFIAHARTDIPALLAALDAANARADKAVGDTAPDETETEPVSDFSEEVDGLAAHTSQTSLFAAKSGEEDTYG
jgi:predicted amidohydrolase YtcJ